MNQGFDGLLSQVKQHNQTVERMLEAEGTVGDWIERETGRTRNNSRLKPIFPKEDFIWSAEEYVFENMGKDMAAKVGAALSLGAIHTADHLGGFYSTQSFQGDLFFQRLLMNLQDGVECIPILAGGCIPLGSSTYARGIITYTETKEARKFPIFPRKAASYMASLAPAFDRDTIEKERVRILAKIGNKAVRREVKYLFTDVYLRNDILSQRSFSRQVLFLGKGIMDRMPYLTGGKSYLYIEIEELFARLIIKELDKKDSFLRELLQNTRVIKCLSELRDIEDRPLSTLLFKGCDSEKRSYTLRLCEDGVLRGTTQNGEEIAVPASLVDIKEKLIGRQILPNFYLSWFLAGFLRGFSFYGGIFQSCYMPNWHELTLSVLKSCGYGDMAKAAVNYVFDGYISGPLVMLFDTGDGATGAGPLEVMATKPLEEQFVRLLDTDIRNAHEMGMFEFYNDLIYGDDKTDFWYGTIAGHLKEKYPENLLQI